MQKRYSSLKNLPTYEQFILENESPIDSNILKTANPGDVVHVAGKPLTIKTIIREKEGSMIEFIAMGNDNQTYKVIYDEGRAAYVLDEFEGSVGPTDSPASDLFLATQTAANGIAF